ncbi:uncharacterized protein PAC_01096 [Phialocephala subalpina]|uniref:Heterokaryon incompatibility domain-containing protein n=1 Tax=Phialocephala subalpina TaxID=576137 RepID=A0A1L7WEL6_9HELO|nr:uncharacterized protein PAC_01096 [Phialocephala subalpina]
MSELPLRNKCTCHICPLHTKSQNISSNTSTNTSNTPPATLQPPTPPPASPPPDDRKLPSHEFLERRQRSIDSLRDAAVDYPGNNYTELLLNIVADTEESIGIKPGYDNSEKFIEAFQDLVCPDEKSPREMLIVLGYLEEFWGVLGGKVKEMEPCTVEVGDEAYHLLAVKDLPQVTLEALAVLGQREEHSTSLWAEEQQVRRDEWAALVELQERLLSSPRTSQDSKNGFNRQDRESTALYLSCQGFTVWLNLPDVYAYLREPMVGKVPFAKPYSHHSIISNLHDAAKNDCQLCQLIVSQLTYDPFWRRAAVEARPESETLHFRLDNRQHDVVLIPYPVSDDLGSYPLSAKSRRIVSRWISECEQGHEECSINVISEGFLPTRLLDIGPMNGSRDPFLLDSTDHLRRSIGLPPVRYATLSHFWGKTLASQVVTATRNLPQRKKRIRMRTLSKTFADAVRITRSLNQRYLWIDSLCIILDSPEDWALESGQMSDVYSNSSINIATVAAENSEQGCLLQHQLARLDLDLERDPQKDEMIHYSLWLRPLAPLISTSPFDAHFTFWGSALYKRAWCYQEFVLAPRSLLHYKHQIRFSCQAFERAEKWPLKRPRFGSHPTVYAGNLNGLFNGSMLQHLYLEDEEETLAMWHETCTEYSTKELTFKKDKLPAISGLAKRFGEVLGGEYLAGLWKDDLPLALCWSTKSFQDQGGWLERITPYATPTWSWASAMGGIRIWIYPFHGSDKMSWDVEVLDSEVETGMDPYGEVTGGHLELGARVLELFRKRHRDATYSASGRCEKVACWDLQCSVFTLEGFAHDTREGYASGERLWGLFIGTLKNNLIDGGIPVEIKSCAILVLQETSQKGVYERVGLFVGHSKPVQTGGRAEPDYASAFDNLFLTRLITII